jgi:predicted MPP superfamily phosphohydrolase
MKPFPSYALLAASLGAGAMAAYAFLVEPRWVEVTRTRIHLRDLPAPLEGLRIALLTDLHAGEGTPMSVIRRACRLAVRERPDVIAITGDLAADDAPDFQAVLEALACLEAPLGVYAVPGNHDHVIGIEKWQREMREHPRIQGLTNRAVVHEIGEARLCIVGVDDLSCGEPSLNSLPSPDQRDVTVLLAHDPDQAERAKRAYDSVDLVLSGHTHGGQIRLPLIGALRNPSAYGQLYEEGLRRRPWTQVYVSRGIGTIHLPARFLCRPEVAILELTAAPRPARNRGRISRRNGVPAGSHRE